MINAEASGLFPYFFARKNIINYPPISCNKHSCAELLQGALFLLFLLLNSKHEYGLQNKPKLDEAPSDPSTQSIPVKSSDAKLL